MSKIASFKLLKADRTLIRNKAISNRFDKEYKKLLAEEEALLLRCYENAIPAEVRRAVTKLPDNWVQRDTDATFNVGGQHIRLQFQHGSKKRITVPQGYYSFHVLGEAISDSELRTAVEDHVFKKKTAEESKERVAIQLGSLLEKCTTVAKLKEVWPEGEKFWKDIDFEGREGQRGGLPAVAMSALNRDLGLA
jgi:hypothetical protein